MPKPPCFRKTSASPAIITHLQSILEMERTAVARELHDEIGGLLVAAAMDVSWAEQHITASEEVLKKLSRVSRTLANAIDLKRTLIEQLRPSLLDNFGLFAAFRWHVAHSCGHVGVKCTHQYPANEPAFTGAALTSLYRILQEKLAIALSKPKIQELSVVVTIDEAALRIRVAHDAPLLLGKEYEASENLGVAMVAMKHRVRELGGRLRVRVLKRGGIVMMTQVPVSNSLLLN